MRRHIGFALILALALAACSSAERVSLRASPTGGPATLHPSDTPGARGSAGTTGARGSQGTQGGSSARPSAEATQPSGPASNNDFALDVTLNRTCAEAGDRMEAKITTIPDVSLAMATQYPDNQQIPDYEYVPHEGNVDGHYTWTWVIRPTIPPGDSSLIVVAAGSGKGGARYVAPFRIATHC